MQVLIHSSKARAGETLDQYMGRLSAANGYPVEIRYWRGSTLNVYHLSMTEAQALREALAEHEALA